MTSTLLKKVERLRYLAILLLSLCGFATANAQLSSDEISEAILVDGSVPVKWTNDATHPWYIPEGESYLHTEDIAENHTATLEFTYSSSYPTEITLSHICWYNSSNNNYLEIIIDGESKRKVLDTSWRASSAYVVPEGSHTVQFVYTQNHSYSGYYAGVDNVRVWECKEPEKACLKDGSMSLTFENESDLDKLWITEDGYVRSTNTSDNSKVSTTFTIEKPSVFSYDYRNKTSYSNCRSNVYVNGLLYTSVGPSQNWSSSSIVLYPGTHTIEFENNIDSNSSHSSYVSEIKNVCLHQNWYEVTLNNPGELGTRVTQILEGAPIQNMDLLKINGAMNSDDWATVKLLTGIKAIDFTNTSITSIPESALSGKSYLSTVMLPETVTSIGNNAFYGTNFYQITIPASVETIGDGVWRKTPLRYITFASDSNLKSIGERAFYETKIIEFDMPDSVETLETDGTYSYIFYGCKSLKKLHISNGVTIIPYGLASDCTALEEVNIPANVISIGTNAFYKTNFKSVTLPETLTTIGTSAFEYSALESVTIPKNVTSLRQEAFANSSNLKEVYLNSHCWNMNYIFRYCTALEKVVIPCATPPTIYVDSYNTRYDPFSGVTKSNVTLVVPDFAFDTYRTDSYWYQFTNTVKGDEASINDYWAIRGTLNLNNTLAMQGTPSVEMMQGGILTLDSDSSQTFDEFTYNTSEKTPSAVLSQSNTVSAGRLVSKFYVDTKDKWFFFSPVTDVNMSDVSYPATDSWVIRYYDGARRATEDATSGNWINVPTEGTLKAGQGYIIQAREAGWLYLPAASTAENSKFFGANAVTFDLADNTCETAANAGWNFVANPYPTYYDIYYIDMQAPITVWDGSTYKAYSLNDGDRGDDTFVLRPMQPFFVQKSAETPDLSTGMPLVGRQVNTTIDRSRAPRPVVKDENRLKLNLELYSNDNEDADDYTRVVLNEQASLAYETVRDASKFMSMDADVAQLYTLGADNHPMAINERPYEDGNVALGVLLPAADRTYRISAPRADRQAWLYDAETGMEFDLTEGDYIFSASKTGIDNKRFSIRFAPASTTAVDEISETVKVAGNVGSISVTAPAGASVAVFGTDGSVIANTVAENGNIEISVAGGVYVVKVNGESHKTIVK